jgi:hypothetical protein
MKKLSLCALAVIAAAITTPALAATVTGTAVNGSVRITGNVAPKCSFTTSSQTITISSDMSDSSGVYNHALDNQTATLVGFCNGAGSTIQVTSYPVVNTVTAPTGFVNRIDYTASATAYNGATAANATPANDASTANSGTSGGTPGTAQTTGLFSGNVVVTLSGSSTGTGLMVAGTYNGLVDVTLTPST